MSAVNTDAVLALTAINLNLEDREGNPYVGRINGALLEESRAGETVYVTEDERVIVYNGRTYDVLRIRRGAAQLPRSRLVRARLRRARLDGRGRPVIAGRR